MRKKTVNVLIAPNSMKGSLNAFEFADTVESAFRNTSPVFSIRKVPVADGGDFTGEVLRHAMQAKIVKMNVKDPLGRPVSSGYAVAGKTAIIEMADASGIKLLTPGELNPMETSSLGTGQLMADAINNGCTEILLGIGGSATVDGGAGMLSALGFQLRNKTGRALDGNGKNLERIREIQKPAVSQNVTVKIICDVDNPLLGISGAAAVFGPQKGASAKMVEKLEKGLANWCNLLESMTKTELASLKGAGAAGGIALPLVAFFNAEIMPGAQFILSLLNFEEHVKWADLVITGEGKIDRQTLHDKAPRAVADMAHMAGKPVIAMAGKVEQEASEAFNGMFSFVNGPVTLEESMKNVKKHVFEFSSELAKLILTFSKK